MKSIRISSTLADLLGLLAEHKDEAFIRQTLRNIAAGTANVPAIKNSLRYSSRWLTITEFAEAANVSRSSVKYWCENGWFRTAQQKVIIDGVEIYRVNISQLATYPEKLRKSGASKFPPLHADSENNSGERTTQAVDSINDTKGGNRL